MHTIYLLLGSNLGDRLDYLRRGRSLIEKEIGKIKESSAIYQTASWGNTDLADFLNQAVCVETELPADDLLLTIHVIEKSLGRERVQKWGARTLDIDILFYDDLVISQPDLTIPHPLLQERRFVLTPLAEIAPGIRHPVLETSVQDLLAALQDELYVERYNNTIMSKETNNNFEVDLSYLNDIADGNAEFIIDMIDIFIEQTPVYFEQLATAIKEKDWTATAAVAHKIKPTLAFIGVEAARQRMAEIERKARDLDHPEEIEEQFNYLNNVFDGLYDDLRKIRTELGSKL